MPLLIEQGEGHVVNTASIAGLTSTPFLGPYNATKHAVVAISESLYKDLQAAGASGVGVSVLCPGFVQTGIAESDRNRPPGRPSTTGDGGRADRAFIQAMVDGGIDPQTVAERVLDAVRDEHLLHPHPPRADAARSQPRSTTSSRDGRPARARSAEDPRPSTGASPVSTRRAAA